jgi:hypothetical protein
MDLFDLRNSLAYGRSIEEVAGFLCRSKLRTCEDAAPMRGIVGGCARHKRQAAAPSNAMNSRHLIRLPRRRA